MDRKEGNGGRGRKKIEMKRILKEDARQVCFSKRKMGIFSKSNNLSILCGADIAILITSPGGKSYSFGSPSVESVLSRFMSDEPIQAIQTPNEGVLTRQLMQEFVELSHKVDTAKARNSMPKDRLKDVLRELDPVWSKNVDDMTMEECVQVKTKLEGLKESAQEIFKELFHAKELNSEPVAASNMETFANISSIKDSVSTHGPWMQLLNINEDEPEIQFCQTNVSDVNGSEKKLG